MCKKKTKDVQLKQIINKIIVRSNFFQKHQEMFDAQIELKKYTMCVRTQYRIAESMNYRLWKRGSYSPETAVTFVRGKYVGKRGVVENVTRNNYLKMRIEFYDEKKNISISDRPSNFSGICL